MSVRRSHEFIARAIQTYDFLRIVFFGHLTPAVEDLRYQHMYHPVPVEQKSPALARVLQEISSGLFGDQGVYEP
jgi:starch phosphorylase